MKKLIPILIFAVLAGAVHAAPITLQNASATFYQTYGAIYAPGQSIDGTTTGDFGWGTYAQPPGYAQTQSWVAETASPISNVGGSTLSINLYQNNSQFSGQSESIYLFKIYVTTDAYGTFGATTSIGNPDGGTLTGNWTLLTPDSATIAASSGYSPTLTIQPDNSVVAGGTIGSGINTVTYNVELTTALTGITGIRLETIKDGANGPGRAFPGANAFVLTEFTLDATASVPEPSTEALLFVSCAGLAAWFLRRKKCSMTA